MAKPASLKPTRRVAIACQGGGAQTAFTAGALKILVAGEREGGYRITGLSGTSGGAICAALAWCGLVAETAREKGRQRAIAMLDAFWHDNSALLPPELIWNGWTVLTAELQDSGLMPTFGTSPYLPPVDAATELLKSVAPRRQFFDLRDLLDTHLPLAEAAQPVAEPRLLVGAVEVLSGQFKAFDSSLAEISLDAILASTTLPTMAKATRIGDAVYWDGLFSQNPPLREFLQGVELGDKPDEIWIVRINPQLRNSEPTTSEAIQDRRNELAGNLSLNQELDFVRKVNAWLASGKLAASDKKPIALAEITMSEGYAEHLDYASKLNRAPTFIAGLMADGEEQAAAFLRGRRAGRK
ncbi:MAG: patatin-like phospholipase family protein [Rhodocyclaceae bacterium]|nr:patatin-like phospholipase family protein [Rhodocyclaceae bacterium]